MLAALAFLVQILVASPSLAHDGRDAGDPPSVVGSSLALSPAAAATFFYFPETGFGIEEPRIADYFTRRGQVKTFGYPISRTVQFLGLPTQFFQRIVLQIGPDGGVRPLNLFDADFLPYTRVNGSTFPAADPRLTAAAPAPDQAGYASAVLEFVRRNAPETFGGQPVRFFSTFNGTVSPADAFPRGGDTGLLPLMNLEIWGVPTSAPAQDPNNGNFVYQRFQRGIMHYDAGCRCTQGLLLADYFKAILTGENLPGDLREQARASAFLGQYKPGGPRALSRPGVLPDTDLSDGFARQERPVSLATLGPASASATGPMRTRIRLDVNLAPAIDALEETDRIGALNAIAESDTRVAFGPLPWANDAKALARYTRVDQEGGRPPSRSIIVNNRLRGVDPKALATVISHEAKHLEDDLAGYDTGSSEACFQFEIRAFSEQAVVWHGFYGPNGKAPPADGLDEELNSWLADYRRGPAELERRVRRAYSVARARGGCL